jgi:hypothetical protein
VIGPGESFFQQLPSEFSFLAHSQDSALESFAGELESLSAAPNPLSAMSFWNWGRRAISLNPFAQMTGLSQVSTPFLDRDLYDFVASLPPDLIRQQEPQTAAIRRAFPEHADIPFYNELPPIRTHTKRTLLQPIVNLWDRLHAVGTHMPAGLISMSRLAFSERGNKQYNAKMNAFLHLTQLSHLQKNGPTAGSHQGLIRKA